ncbi:MAG: DUF899 family protein [candidate division Zixibacteria bacterium]|nr:DUF899 family protein [candidate division Zixibacteria bacterium]
MTTQQKSRVKKQIEKMEKERIKSAQKLAKMRKSLPREAVKNYTFKDKNGKPVKMFSLFGGKQDLIVIHNMGKRCVYCTMWADGFNGIRHHMENRAGFVVISPDPPGIQKKFAASRNWKFNMLSAHGTDFNKNMGYESPKGDPWPGVSMFHRKNGKVYRVSHAGFGPWDDYCTVWHLFDLLADGSNGWEPKYKY